MPYQLRNLPPSEKDYKQEFMKELTLKNPGETEFHQAVEEVVDSVIPFILENPKYYHGKILERLVEPDRIISFRVCWEDDKGEIQVNKGFRVQFNNAIGPYKGGLRFHPSVSQSVLKFLGFEQIFKNSLTTLPLGGGKGGSDFDPKGKSNREIMRFCQSYMTELSKHIGENTDIPAGDIGVGAREVSYLYGQYKRLNNKFVGVLTGKGIEYGGSKIRTEATGYGLIYFCQNVLSHIGEDFNGKECIISGSGNVAQFASKKLIELGAKVITLSDSTGFIHVPEGLSSEHLKFVSELKLERKGLAEFSKKFGHEFIPGKKPWHIKADLAFPCATQNEITEDDAITMVNNGVRGVFEGANMPTTAQATKIFLDNKLLFGPGKAANAGGVAISGLEMTQNSMRMSWNEQDVDEKLKQIMAEIHRSCVKYGEEKDFVNYVKGANIAGFIKVAEAMLAYGVY
jgi:glutamate dehydrogenase (NADP+)